MDQCIGDSIGPGGIFRALRTIPVLIDMAKGMQRALPERDDAQLRKPHGRVLLGAGDGAGAEFVGLCHGVQTTMDLIAGYVGVPKDEIDYIAPGSTTWRGSSSSRRTARTCIRPCAEKFEKPEYYINEKVRGEVMRHFGYFMTESTGHLSEYIPWFRSSQKALDLYCDQPDFGGASGAYYKYSQDACGEVRDQGPAVDRVQEARQTQRGVLLVHHRGAFACERPSGSTATFATTR